jgi:hypothetical protein
VVRGGIARHQSDMDLSSLDCVAWAGVARVIARLSLQCSIREAPRCNAG